MAERNQETVARIEEIADRVGRSENIELVDVQLLGAGRSRVLRLYIDKPGGVTHADCEYMSQQVGLVLDAEDVIPGEEGYTLEVSSPGVERRLKKPRDFERFAGQRIKVALREPVDNQKRWEGVLSGYADGTVTLEAPGGKTLRFTLDQIKEANLKFEWGKG